MQELIWGMQPYLLGTSWSIRLLNFVKRWIEVWYPLVSSKPKISAAITKISEKMEARLPVIGGVIKDVISRLDKGTPLVDYLEDPPEPIPPSLGTSECSLLNLNELEVARQLCLIEIENFSYVFCVEMIDCPRKLIPSDFYHARWTKEGDNSKIHDISRFSNNLTVWFCYQVLSQPTVTEQSKVLLHVLKIVEVTRK